ncbi:DUF4337 domain-containing protein [Syntrophobacter fumaroxidans]|uniref:Transmembrane protein n=1 Tax=Syntrophobacter fumaroxidans (strain DSM 10017 / MPOB) TaxID=335543 RepID=A0LMW5_SYNFM|nr:DUF4337 domain-containing protein [Syntrophobacter fumaroxidans]ABK18767.1 conserved hypothetical protein [Syntrophobacter fumaroxidans MPOB]
MGDIELPDPDELRDLKEKTFTRRVALVTALFAVMLAITALGGNNAMKAMMLAQQQASNQWAFYQAKVIREHLYRNETFRLQLELLSDKASMKPEVRKELEAAISRVKEEEQRYGREKKEIEQEAKALERERDMNMAKDPYFDYAEVLLQIALVMASISILSSSRMVFFFALGAAICGTILCVNGYLLLFSLPFLS